MQKTEAGQTSYTVYGSNGKLLHKLKGGVATHYVYAGGLLIAELNGATVNYLHTDLLGSPIKGDNGTAYAEHYRPWGEKKDHPAQLADDVGYTGHQNDIATGLTYMQARYYDPVVGRFMAVDPLSFLETGDPLYFGRYGYAGNNPISYVDPTGRGTIYFGLDVWLASPKDTPAVRVTTPDGTVSEYKGATAAVGVYVSFPTFFGDDSSARFDVGGYVTRGVSTMDDPDDADKGGAGVSVGLDLGLARGDDRTFSGEGSAINADAMVVGGDILLDESGELLGANISGGVGLGYGEINTTTSAGGVRAVIDKIKDWWSK